MQQAERILNKASKTHKQRVEVSHSLIILHIFTLFSTRYLVEQIIANMVVVSMGVDSLVFGRRGKKWVSAWSCVFRPLYAGIIRPYQLDHMCLGLGWDPVGRQ